MAETDSDQALPPQRGVRGAHVAVRKEPLLAQSQAESRADQASEFRSRTSRSFRLARSLESCRSLPKTQSSRIKGSDSDASPGALKPGAAPAGRYGVTSAPTCGRTRAGEPVAWRASVEPASAAGAAYTLRHRSMPSVTASMRPIFAAAVDFRVNGESPVTVWQVVHSVETARSSSKLNV
jgi:hypothetical protein